MALADITHMDASSIALQGLQQADTQLNAAASAIANAGANSAPNAPVDVVDLSSEIVALMSAQNAFDANHSALQTADQIQETLVDITA